MSNFILSAFCDECGEETIQGQINACLENNISLMELRGFGKDLNVNNMTISQAKKIKAEIDNANLTVFSIGSHYGKINIKDDFKEHFNSFKNTIEVAKILNAKSIRIFSFYFDENDCFNEYREEVINRIRKLTDYALKNGIIPCHENEKGIYGDTALRCLDVLSACEGNLRAVFDPANFVQCNQNTIVAYEILEPYIEYFHIKDALYSSGEVVPAGQGDGNIEEILNRVCKVNHKMVLSLEPHLKAFEGHAELEKPINSTSTTHKNIYSSNIEMFKKAVSNLQCLINL